MWKFYSKLRQRCTFLKEDMYSYHYYKRRTVVKPARTSEYFVQAALFCGMAYAIVTLVVMFR